MELKLTFSYFWYLSSDVDFLKGIGLFPGPSVSGRNRAESLLLDSSCKFEFWAVKGLGGVRIRYVLFVGNLFHHAQGAVIYSSDSPTTGAAHRDVEVAKVWAILK